MRNVSDKSCTYIQSTHFMFNKFSRNRAVYEIMWENMVQPYRPEMTVGRMRISCRIPNATNTHSEYVILITFPHQQWLHVRSLTLRYSKIPALFLTMVRFRCVYIFKGHPCWPFEFFFLYILLCSRTNNLYCAFPSECISGRNYAFHTTSASHSALVFSVCNTGGLPLYKDKNIHCPRHEGIQGGVDVQLHSYLISAPDRGCCTPRKNSSTHLIWGKMGPITGLDVSENKYLLLQTRLEPRTIP